MSAITGNLHGIKNNLDFGANVNHTTKDGISPFLAAAMFSETTVAKMLLNTELKSTFRTRMGRRLY